jgi:hypothetical protein
MWISWSAGVLAGNALAASTEPAGETPAVQEEQT